MLTHNGTGRLVVDVEVPSVDGVLLRGKQGYAGQVGHTPFLDNGITCSCGKRGCWVTEIGVAAIRRKLTAAGVDLPGELAAGVDWLELVCEKACAGDAGVIAVLEGVARQIGSGLSRLVETFNPRVVIVGGRLGKLMQCVEPVIEEALLADALPYMAKDVELKVSGAGDDHTMGCLATVFDAILQNPPNAGGS